MIRRRRRSARDCIGIHTHDRLGEAILRKAKVSRDPISREEARRRLERRYLEHAETAPLPIPLSMREYVKRNIEHVQEKGLLESYASRDPRRRARSRRDDVGAGSEAFVRDLERQLRIGDRQIHIRNHHSLTGYYDVTVDYINLPKGIGGAGGGAEAHNNRLLVFVRGFDRHDPKAPPPKGKVTLETSTSSLYKGSSYSRENRVSIRGRTGTPAQIAKYLADQLNRIAAEVPPRFTHTTMGDPRRRRRAPLRRRAR